MHGRAVVHKRSGGRVSATTIRDAAGRPPCAVCERPAHAGSAGGCKKRRSTYLGQTAQGGRVRGLRASRRPEGDGADGERGGAGVAPQDRLVGRAGFKRTVQASADGQCGEAALPVCHRGCLGGAQGRWRRGRRWHQHVKRGGQGGVCVWGNVGIGKEVLAVQGSGPRRSRGASKLLLCQCVGPNGSGRSYGCRLCRRSVTSADGCKPYGLVERFGRFRRNLRRSCGAAVTAVWMLPRRTHSSDGRMRTQL